VSEEKIYMLNAIWFKPNGGEQRYKEYLSAATPLINNVGGKRLKSLVPERELIGEFDANLVFIVEYPNWSAYKKFANSSDYHQIAYLRKEAVEKSLLIRCVRPNASFS
jgi:uncharacterized protein (DUF1330 family)